MYLATRKHGAYTGMRKEHWDHLGSPGTLGKEMMSLDLRNISYQLKGMP